MQPQIRVVLYQLFFDINLYVKKLNFKTAHLKKFLQIMEHKIGFQVKGTVTLIYLNQKSLTKNTFEKKANKRQYQKQPKISI